MKKHPSDQSTERLPFELPPRSELSTEPKVKKLQQPIWTENKAKLIERYLLYFVYITKHGAYIDGFAGPQNPTASESWAAKLVLENEPRWLRNFYLFDSKQHQYERLEELQEAQPPRKDGESKRQITVKKGDFNILVHELLASQKIGEKEATFCLLDQRTFECKWATVKAVADYKKQGHKIEIFYFLANSWLDRALAAQQKKQVIAEWWGRDDWQHLRNFRQKGRADVLISRFKKELGYKSVKRYPIFERRDGGAVMYYMIHATDHPEAPTQMARAYNKALHRKEPEEQLLLEFKHLAAKDGD